MASIQQAFNSMIQSTLHAATMGAHTIKNTQSYQAAEQWSRAKRGAKRLRELTRTSSGERKYVSTTAQEAVGQVMRETEAQIKSSIAKDPTSKKIKSYEEFKGSKEEYEKYLEQQRAEDKKIEDAQAQQEAAYEEAQNPAPEEKLENWEDEPMPSPGESAAFSQLVQKVETQRNQKAGLAERKEELKNGE